MQPVRTCLVCSPASTFPHLLFQQPKLPPCYVDMPRCPPQRRKLACGCPCAGPGTTPEGCSDEEYSEEEEEEAASDEEAESDEDMYESEEEEDAWAVVAEPPPQEPEVNRVLEF